MHEYKGIKVGDVVTAYRSGYWKVVQIQDRSHLTYNHPAPNGSMYPEPMVILELVMSEKGVRPKKKGKADQCDISYCNRVTRESAEDAHRAIVEASANIRDGIYNILGDLGL